MIQRHGQDAQTLHAELTALLLADEGDRGWGALDGAFVHKTIHGRDYVYFQWSEPGGQKRQVAVGPDSAEVQAVVADYRLERTKRDPDLARRERLAALLVTAGLRRVPHGVGRVLQALADAGVFRVGGVLVGTHAFAVLGDMLGVQWPAGSWATEDIDIASRTEIEIATPLVDADVPKALDGLRMGFVPVPEFDARHPSTSFKVRGQQLRVDLQTPGSDRQTAPVYIPRLNAMAAPIKFLSLLMADPVPGVLLHKMPVLVMVPTPARFALHKLLVSQTRPVVQQTKAGEDLQQAAAVLAVLTEDRPDDLDAALPAFRKAGPIVTKKLVRAARIVAERHPEAAEAVRSVLRRLG